MACCISLKRREEWVENHTTRCRYPSWVTEHHLWHTLDHKRDYHFSQKNATLKITASSGDPNDMMRVVCHSLEVTTEKQAMIIAHMTTGCHSGYVCLLFYRRDGHVIELQQSISSSSNVPEDACHPSHFQPASLPYVTLITGTPRNRQCPYLGRYSVTSHVGRHASSLRDDSAPGVDLVQPCSDQQFQSLSVGCGADDTMKFHSTCNSETVSTYSCHGSWDDNGTKYLIASPTSRKSGAARRYCFIYTASSTQTNGVGVVGEVGVLQVASVAESCHRNLAHATQATWAFNLTAYTQCGEASSGAAERPPSLLKLALAGLSFLVAQVR